MPLVDGHLHVFVPVSERYPRDTHELFPADLGAPVEDYLAIMDEVGVDHAVLVPLSRHDDYVRECVARYPRRFAAVGVHDPAAPDPVDDVRRRREQSGLQGLRVHHLGSPDAPDPETLDAFPTLAALDEEEMVLWFYAAPDQLRLLPDILQRLPRLRVMLNHLGFCQQGYEKDEYGRPRIPTPLPPPTLSTVLDMARFPNVYVMFSGQYAFSREPYPYDDLRDLGVRLLQAFGAHRLMWASDYPWIREEPGYRRMLELVDHALPGLSDDERAAITGGTATRLFTF